MIFWKGINMQVTVNLQSNYSYIPMVLLFLAALVLIVLLILWAAKEKRRPKETKKTPQPEPVNPRSRAMELKRRYDRKLAQLEADCEKGAISERKAYQKLSALVRSFAHEMTGIKVSNYTLQELRQAGMPQLTALIEECYVPEFAPGNEGQAKEAIKKARKVIAEWI